MEKVSEKSTAFCGPTLFTLKATELTTSGAKQWESSRPQRESLDTPKFFWLGLRVAKTITDSWFVTYLCKFGVFLSDTVFIVV